jgi:hypothetical protein
VRRIAVAMSTRVGFRPRWPFHATIDGDRTMAHGPSSTDGEQAPADVMLKLWLRARAMIRSRSSTSAERGSISGRSA